MGNVPRDGTDINCYGMGMGQINMSHGQARQGCPWKCHSYRRRWATATLLKVSLPLFVKFSSGATESVTY